MKRSDRVFFSLAKGLINNWKDNLVIVKPETVIKWHRYGFKLLWKIKSKRSGGRERISFETRRIIIQLAEENKSWGIPRIHGELLKLGFNISQSTVFRYLQNLRRNKPSQNWVTFLRNHSKEIISMDFFTVPTINFKILHVLVMIENHRRKIIHFNVTEHPTSIWSAQQMRNALYNDNSYKYVIRDRDCKFGKYFEEKINDVGINEIVTEYRSPWQNGYVERVIGTIRRECLDHFIVFNETHLREILKEYFYYYNKFRTHLGLDKDTPENRPIEPYGEIKKTTIIRHFPSK
ncbi:MAG: transposase [Labilibaculum sp.]|nr:integrase core domain-containing protein [Labilibaculum sp.]MBI9060163.1 transposase [Labilibaculum sp.]